MLPVALYLISRAAQPIAAIPGPPAANSHLEAGPPPHWDPVAMGHPSYAQQQYPGDYNFPGAATTQSAGHRGKDHLSRHFASPVSTASSTSSSSETSTSSPKPREMEEAYNRHPTIAEQLQHPAISPAQAYATRMSQPVGAHIEEADESQEPTEPAYTTQAPAPSHSKHKSHHKTKKHRHPKKKVNIRLPSPGSSPLQHDRSHYEYAPPASPSSSSIDPLAPPPPMPHAQPQGLSSIPKKKKKKKSYPMKPMMPLKTMEQQFHPGAAEREASKAQRYQQAAQSAGGMTQGGHPSYYGNVGAMRGPPGMAPPNQARSGLPQQFRYPGVAV